MRKLIIVLALLSIGCHKKKIEPLAPSYPVEIGVALEKNAEIYVEALGHIDSITNILIRSRVEGELTGVFFEQGQEVQKGDLLFTIDPKPFEADLKQTKGLLEETLANLSLAKEKVKRYRTLAKDEYFSQIDYETLQSNFAALTGKAAQYQGQVDSALVALDYCWIYAPIDGKTGILNIDYGNLVSADGAEPLVTLNQMTPIYVTFSIPEFQLQRVLKYQKQNELKILAAFEDFSGEFFEGNLYMIDNEVDPETGMVKIRAIFENNDRLLWPGQFIRTRLILTTLPNATIVPYSAVQLTPEGPILFVVKENMTVDERKVKLGQRQDENIIVLEGVKSGEKIVLEGQINLFTGSKVFVPDIKP